MPSARAKRQALPDVWQPFDPVGRGDLGGFVLARGGLRAYAWPHEWRVWRGLVPLAEGRTSTYAQSKLAAASALEHCLRAQTELRRETLFL